MDAASLLGIALASAAVVYTVTADGGRLDPFVSWPSLACVVCGTAAALLTSFPLRSVVGLGRATRTALFYRPPDFQRIVAELTTLAEQARRRGLLAIDRDLEEIREPFVVSGVRLAVDGVRPEVVEEILRAEMAAAVAEHRTGKMMFELLGKYAPAFGLIGTLLGLVMMLGRMTDPDAIGPGMATALLTTLYGALLSNVVCLPLADKLNFLCKQETLAHELILRGVLAVQAGDHPRVVHRRLSVHLSVADQPRYARAA